MYISRNECGEMTIGVSGVEAGGGGQATAGDPPLPPTPATLAAESNAYNNNYIGGNADLTTPLTAAIFPSSGIVNSHGIAAANAYYNSPATAGNGNR